MHRRFHTFLRLGWLAAFLLHGVCLLPLRAQDPDLRTQIRTWDAALSSGSPLNDPAATAYAGNGHAVACLAATESLLHGWFPADGHAAAAKARLDILLTALPRYYQGFRSASQSSPSTGVSSLDFFTPYPLMVAYARLDAAGQLDATLRARLEDFAYTWFTRTDAPGLHPDELNNTALTRATGYRLAANLLASSANTPARMARRKEWLDYAAATWARFTTLGDITENATQYIGISAAQVWPLGDAMGDASAFDAPSIRAMFVRLRDQLGPAGQMGLYGDSFNANKSDNWAVAADWTYPLYAYERAAARYRDPTFRWAANLLAQAGFARQPLNSGYRPAMPLLFLALAEDARQTTLVPTAPTTASALQTRLNLRLDATGNPEIYPAPDKLLLAPSRAPGQPFALFDLFPPNGWHSHLNQPGALTYFQSGGVPLLTSIDGNLRGAEDTNLLLIRPASDTFPRRSPDFAVNTWYSTEYPLANIRWLGAEGRRRFERLTLRISLLPASSGSSNSGALTVDRLSLVGPAGSLSLDSFDTLNGWGIPSGATTTIVPGTEGAGALRIGITNTTTATRVLFVGRTFPVTDVDLSQYSQLAVDWRVEGAMDKARPFILRVEETQDAQGRGSYMTDFISQSTQLGGRLTDAAQISSAGYHLGDLRLDQYFTADTATRRRTVLDPRGVLLVRDDLFPGPAAAGRTAGPIWQLGPIAAPETGSNWADSNGADTDLFIWQSPGPGRTHGVTTFQQGNSRANQRTVFSRQSIAETPRPIRFTTVLIPHAPSVSGATLASTLALSDSGADGLGRTELAYGLDGVTYRAFLDVLRDDGASSVIEFGDPLGLSTFVARSPARLRQTTSLLATDAAELRLDTRITASGRSPLRLAATALKNLSLGTRTLFTASNPVDVHSLNFSSTGPTTARVSTSATTAIQLHTPNATDPLWLNGTVLDSTHDPVLQIRSFTLPSGTEQRLIIGDPALALRWALDETFGPSAIDSVFTRDGSLINDPAWQSAPTPSGVGSLRFDGVDDLVRYEGSSVTAYPFTITAWVRTADTTQMSAVSLLPSSASGIVFDLGLNAGRARLIARNTTIQEISGLNLINDDTWHHLAAVFTSPTERALYVDGALQGTDTTAVAFPGATLNRLAAGCYDQASPTHFFKGQLADIRIYTRALTASDLALPSASPVSTTSVTPYEAWTNRVFSLGVPEGDRAPLSDPDSDGAKNLVEYALGTDPESALSTPLLLPSLSDIAPMQPHLTLDYTRPRLAALDLTYAAQSCTNLTGPWSGADVAETITLNDGVTQFVRVTTPLDSFGKKFLRLMVSSITP